jgi:DNA polymerase-3 subunit gamma/tau
MTYQILARKWRPQDFQHLIGQEPIVQALRNALAEGRIAQAYLFSGIRGVGKTTAARLLAKCLNCERGPTPDPCGECVACREIALGSDLDVIEVDAATHSKVEQARELTESLRYGPARDRYKVVVLDEVHRLSRQAFDALLKIVEEPPPHVVFVFATTEIEAVPATILSRCQEYAFRRVPAAVLAAHLREIATAESIDASDAALRLIARAGEGSVRDSVALLDQLATFGGGKIDEAQASHLIGGLDTAAFARLLEAMLAGRTAEVSAVARAIESEGRDARRIYAHYLGFVREALQLALGGDPRESELPAEEAARLRESARRAGYENLLRLLHHLLQSETMVRRSEVGALAVEVAWLRAAELPRLVALESLLAGAGRSDSATPDAVLPAPAAPAPKPREAERPAMPPAAAPAAPPAASPFESEPAAEESTVFEPRFEALVEAVSRSRPAFAARLRQLRAARFEGDELVLIADPGDRDVEGALKRPANAQALDDALRASGGGAPRVRIERGGAGAGGPGRSAVAAAPATSPAALAAERHPTVQALLQIFDGSVAEVVPKAGGR